MKRNPVMILKTLKRRGVQLTKKESVLVVVISEVALLVVSLKDCVRADGGDHIGALMKQH
jgi:hypothetical protein